MSDYWTSTRTPPRAFDARSYHNAERDAVIRDAEGVDPALLSIEVGLSPMVVRAYQRHVGVRRVTGRKRRAAS